MEKPGRAGDKMHISAMKENIVVYRKLCIIGKTKTYLLIKIVDGTKQNTLIIHMITEANIRWKAYEQENNLQTEKISP